MNVSDQNKRKFILLRFIQLVFPITIALIILSTINFAALVVYVVGYKEKYEWEETERNYRPLKYARTVLRML